MATQTGSYDFKAAKQAKLSAEATAAADATTKANDAKKVATNFIATDSSGIMVYDGTSGTHTPSNPGTNTRNVLIDSDSVDIRQGTDVLATFGSFARIGADTTSNIKISNNQIDFNTNGVNNAISMKMDGDGGEITFGSRTLKPRISSATDNGNPQIYMTVPAQTATDTTQIILKTEYDDTVNDRFSDASVWVQVDEEKPFIMLDNSYRVENGLRTSGCQISMYYDGNIHISGTPNLLGDSRETFYKASRVDNETSVWFGCGNATGRHGVYSGKTEKWIIMCDDTTGNIYIGGTTAKNKISGWVCESDTVNDWTYRKYSDGTFDAWGTFTVTPTSSTASGNIYYSNAISVNLPFTASSGSVIVTGSVGSQYAWLVNTSSASTTVSFRIARGAAISTSTALSVRLHVFGDY